tara:strand:- start:180 stop:416 length:237 start_codon:yes stop_codon:yes gene_type:complete
MTEKDNILHGWFSQTQKKYISQVTPLQSTEKTPISNIYLNIDGKEVEVTEVKHSKDICVFEDAEYVGICIKWVRSIYN